MSEFHGNDPTSPEEDVVQYFKVANRKIKVAFDVDGTLIYQAGELYETPRYDMVQAFKFFESIGCHMIIWSGGGMDYAERWAQKLGLKAQILEKSSIKVDITFDDLFMTAGAINLMI